MISKGELDVPAGRTPIYSSELLNNIAQKGKDASLDASLDVTKV